MLPSINDPEPAGASFFITDVIETKSSNAAAKPGPSPLAKPRRREASQSPSPRRFLSPSPSDMTFEEKLDLERDRAQFADSRSKSILMLNFHGQK